MMKFTWRQSLGTPLLGSWFAATLGGMILGLVIKKSLLSYGRSWSEIGLILGCVVGGCASIWAYSTVIYHWIKQFVAFPICRNGVCKQFPLDYGTPRGSMHGWIEVGRSNYQCRCGVEYLRWNNRFLVIDSDRTISNYKVLDTQGNWVDDFGPDIEQYKVADVATSA